MPVNASAEMIAVASPRQSRRRKKYSRNTAGVSLMAIASPVSVPPHHRPRPRITSTSTSAIKKTLTCPNPIVSRTGPNHIPTVTAASVSHHSCAAGRSQVRVSTSCTTSARTISVASVMSTDATGSGTSVRIEKICADSGG